MLNPTSGSEAVGTPALDSSCASHLCLMRPSPLPGLLDFDELLASLAGAGDPLGAMAALELLQDLSQRVDVAAAGLLGATAVPRLLAMTRSGEAMLRAQALQARRWPLVTCYDHLCLGAGD